MLWGPSQLFFFVTYLSEFLDKIWSKFLDLSNKHLAEFFSLQ